MGEAVNKGYLLENFRLFHLKDQRAQPVEPHYHEFDKLVVLYSGAVDYTVEGICYRMQPGDILFVRHADIHRPVISPDSVYERAILWIAPEFLERSSTAGEPLGTCFDLASQRHSCLYRPSEDSMLRIRKRIAELEKALEDDAFGSELLANTLFLQLMVECNRCVLHERPESPQNVDPKIDSALRYINNNLAEGLSVETLSAMCYMSRFYFMRRFKESTGYTVHSYIQQKRLNAAAGKLEEGMNVTEAALEVGFSEYSSFLRAFRKNFGMTPTAFLHRKKEMGSDYRE